MIDKNTFVSNFPKELDQDGINKSQVQGFGVILDYWNRNYPTSDIRYLAYILATAWHECAKTMRPIEEWGKGKGLAYGVPDPVTGKVYYGRGYVQLTHKVNYSKFSHLLLVDLVENPDLALQPNISVQILFKGMFGGMFTGARLSKYFNVTTEDWVNARRIINGTDKAELIAGYAKLFYDLVKVSSK